MDLAANLGALAGALLSAGAKTLGGILGGSVGGPAGAAGGAVLAPVIVDMIAGRLGLPADPDGLAKAIETDPAARAKVQQLDADQGPALAASVRELELRLADVQDARAQTVALAAQGSPIAYGAVIMSVIGLAILGGVVMAVTYGRLPDNGLVVGWALGMGTTIFSYWLGSSNGSAAKDQRLARIESQPSLGQAAGRVIDAVTQTAKTRR